MAYDYNYMDTECHVSLAQLSVALWLFPALLRFTAGPLATVEMNDFRVKVFSSEATPLWIVVLRRNLISTALNGDTIRLDDFETNINIRAVVPDGDDASSVDESRLSASFEGWHIFNWQKRMYTFGRIDAQLRRSWVDIRDTKLVIIATESRWTKMSSTEQPLDFRSFSWW